jgi:hypothetical protein
MLRCPQGALWTAVDKWRDSPELLSKRLQQGVDEVVEGRVPVTELFDLFHGVDDGRVMLAAEALADLRQ